MTSFLLNKSLNDLHLSEVSRRFGTETDVLSVILVSLELSHELVDCDCLASTGWTHKEKWSGLSDEHFHQVFELEDLSGWHNNLLRTARFFSQRFRLDALTSVKHIDN